VNASFWLSLLFLCSFIQRGFSQLKVSAVKYPEKIDIWVNNNLFTSYLFSENEKYPFFFPVNGPSNASVTSMRNANYPHHSSLFFGCDKVNGGNYWQEGLERGQIISLRADIIPSDEYRVIIENECIWRRPGANAPIKDLRRITLSAPSGDLYQMDVDITMEMLENVRIEKTNHSLFSVRLDPDLSVIHGGTMINAAGAQGEKGTFGIPSPWIDCFGKRGEKMEGLAILQHPSNPDYPAPWFTRDYGFFSPTPMYWPKDEKVGSVYKKGDSVTLRYRVLVHSGNHEFSDIAGRFEAYKKE
jgi:hypothetical protein